MIFSWLYLFIFLQFIIPSAAALIPLVATLAGTTTSGNTNGEGTNARFNGPHKGDISPDGTIFLVADWNNHLLRQIIITTSTVSTLAGQAGASGNTNGEGTNALFKNPSSISYSPDGTYALITDANNNLIRKIILSTAAVTKFAGGGSIGDSSGSTNGEGTNVLFNHPHAICISPDSLTAIIADIQNNLIRKIIITTSRVSTLAGQTTSGSNNGIGTLAKFNIPISVDYYPDGSAILVADHYNSLIRKIIISTALVSTLAGVATTTGSTNGIGTNARFNLPFDIRISPNGSYALVADLNNHMIRSIILSTLFVTTIIGTTTSGTANGIGTNALLNGPRGVSIAPNGEYFQICDASNNMIRTVNILNHPNVLPRILLTFSQSSTSPSRSEEPPPATTPPSASSACPPGYFRKIDGDSTSSVVLEEPSPSDGRNENSSPTSELPTCNVSDEKTDTLTTMVKTSNSEAYLIVFCLILLVVIIVLILYFGSKMTKADENHILIQELKQSLLDQVGRFLTLHSHNTQDQLISELQADIVRKDRELEEFRQA